ncbi:hypothetical protein HanIR_Chr05g0214141 [Helianthus annuus]|nr:hypothetical protein HanIR_Chr05g0214141 [Helianthus annuus]
MTAVYLRFFRHPFDFVARIRGWCLFFITYHSLHSISFHQVIEFYLITNNEHPIKIYHLNKYYIKNPKLQSKKKKKTKHCKVKKKNLTFD